MANEILHDWTQHLPPEIILRIFTLVWDGPVFVPYKVHGYPWTLGHVCSRWRHIVWGESLIWGWINIAQNYGTVHKDGSSDALNYILSRISGPVSLVVDMDDSDGSAFMTIFEHLDRYIDLSISGSDDSVFTSLFNLPPDAFPQLESLSLVMPTKLSSATITSPFESAPNLRYVEYKPQHTTYTPVFLRLPWAQIEGINIQNMCIPAEIVWEVFRSSPLLLSCHLHIDNTPTPSTTPPIILSALEELYLAADIGFNWNTFLRPIVTPSLLYLTVASEDIPCLPLARFLVRSKCSLLAFDVSGIDPQIYADDDNLELLFDQIPSVMDLRLSWHITPLLFRRIHAGALPELVTATFTVYPDGLGALMDMLDAYGDFPERKLRNLGIGLYIGLGYSEQCDRYLENYKAYMALDGLRIRVFDWDNLASLRPL